MAASSKSVIVCRGRFWLGLTYWLLMRVWVRREWKITREAAASCIVTLPHPWLDQPQHQLSCQGRGEVPNRFLNMYTHKKCCQAFQWGRECYAALPYAIFTVFYIGFFQLRGWLRINRRMILYKWIYKE